VTAVAPALHETLRLDGRRAVVTGAGRGIGRAYALALAAAGADVVALSRTASELEEVVAAAGDRARAIACDVTDAHAVSDRIGVLERIDVLVTSAGANIPEPFLDVPPEHLDALLAVNVRGTFLAAQAAARRMVATGGGAIVTVSSQMGHVGAAGRTVYCASKHAVEGFSEALRLEVEPYGIEVTTICLRPLSSSSSFHSP
jgi:NAD(P)-dependent dehydrogenase (short-subunit alcohol dehydrogenase family)